MTRTELIAALEAAEGPSRELDREIPRSLGYTVGMETFRVSPDALSMWLPRYTESLDAALSFTPEGWNKRFSEEDDGKWWAEIRRGYATSYSTVCIAKAATPAIALCIANLRALEAQEKASMPDKDMKATDGILNVARLLARDAHKGQTRKYSGAPYINHPKSVVQILRDCRVTDEDVLAAAWLHDVVEDCGVTYDYIRSMTNQTVALLVWWVTDDPSVNGNRAFRKFMARERISAAPVAAQMIKMADLIDNTVDIAQHDPKFAKVYIEEKRALLEELPTPSEIPRHRGVLDSYQALWGRAFSVLSASERYLKQQEARA